jgi:hypothetical protein
MMVPAGGFSIHTIAAFIPLPLPAVAPPSGGNITTAPASGHAGSTVSIPVKLELNSGITLDMLSFALQITPNGSAAPLTGNLSFRTGSSLPAPTSVDTSIGPNGIAVSWLAGSGLSLPGTAVLGNVMVTIPSSALGGQKYTIHVVAAFATSGRNSVDIAVGGDNLLTVTNSPPVANAGVNQTVPAAAGCITLVTLDGTRSSDPDGDPLTFTWTGPFGTVTGATPAVNLGIGANTITLTVSDGQGGTDSATVVVTVRDVIAPITASIRTPSNANGWNNTDVIVVLNAADDCSGVREIVYSLSGAQTGGGNLAGSSASVRISQEGTTTLAYFARDNAGNNEAAQMTTIKIDKTAPTLTCSAAPAVLWPANHKMVPVSTTVNLTDSLSGPAGFVLAGISSNDPGTGPTDITGFEIARPSTTGSLRADRSNKVDSRIYTLFYKGTDIAGNLVECVTVSIVPHDMRTSSIATATVEGVLTVRHNETSSIEQFGYSIDTRSGPFELLFPVIPGFVTGDRIRAHGFLIGSTMVIDRYLPLESGLTHTFGPQPTLALL